MKRIIPYTQNQEMINLALECQGTEEFEHTVNDQILHELIELRKFVERVETVPYGCTSETVSETFGMP